MRSPAPTHVDTLADRLRDSAVPLEQQTQALVDLERGLSQLSVEPVSSAEEIERERNLAKAKQIAAMTQLGELPGLAGLDASLEAGAKQRLHALCAQPISREVAAEFLGVLDQLTKDARSAAARLKDMEEQAERDRRHRDLLRDLSELMAVLLAGSDRPETASGELSPPPGHATQPGRQIGDRP